ncbi:hypothetical protein WOLCODRAFT_149327 [Wolfiporia cocos MD-104 SS10]|uniref:Uncharacterized protein n=1 Tax=Wolfiporia cocos (strain MD-104) TaxID=742152 RepID=A0A2H3JKX2_WOLCO|nr:hypothetical protein WOLCODRAFT_149327 [Wolfiporia cocos MD-104 SS10]
MRPNPELMTEDCSEQDDLHARPSANDILPVVADGDCQQRAFWAAPPPYSQRFGENKPHQVQHKDMGAFVEHPPARRRCEANESLTGIETAPCERRRASCAVPDGSSIQCRPHTGVREQYVECEHGQRPRANCGRQKHALGTEHGRLPRACVRADETGRRSTRCRARATTLLGKMLSQHMSVIVAEKWDRVAYVLRSASVSRTPTPHASIPDVRWSGRGGDPILHPGGPHEQRGALLAAWPRSGLTMRAPASKISFRFRTRSVHGCSPSLVGDRAGGDHTRTLIINVRVPRPISIRRGQQKSSRETRTSPGPYASLRPPPPHQTKSHKPTARRAAVAGAVLAVLRPRGDPRRENCAARRCTLLAANVRLRRRGSSRSPALRCRRAVTQPGTRLITRDTHTQISRR